MSETRSETTRRPDAGSPARVPARQELRSSGDHPKNDSNAEDGRYVCRIRGEPEEEILSHPASRARISSTRMTAPSSTRSRLTMLVPDQPDRTLWPAGSGQVPAASPAQEPSGGAGVSSTSRTRRPSVLATRRVQPSSSITSPVTGSRPSRSMIKPPSVSYSPSGKSIP